MHRKMSVLEKFGFASGDVAINFILAAITFFLPYFYTDIYGIKPVHMGVLFLVARLFDAFTDPLMGYLTSKYATRWGVYRHYFVYLAVPYAISFTLLFATPELQYNLKLVWVYATYLLCTLVLTGIAIPYISYISVLTESPSDKISANAYRLFFARVGSVLFVSSIPILIQYFDSSEYLSSWSYSYAMVTFGVVGAFFLVFCFTFTEERITKFSSSISITDSLKGLLRNDQWRILCVLAIIGTLAYGLRGSVAIFYAAHYLGGDSTQVSLFISSGIAMSMLSMFLSAKLATKVCKVKIFKFSQYAAGLLCGCIYFVVHPGDIVTAFIINLVLCLVVDLQAPIYWSALAEASDYGERKFGPGTSALFFSSISLAQKIGGGLSGFLIGVLLAYYGYDGNLSTQSENTLKGLAIILVGIPGIIHIVMGAIMHKYIITDRFYMLHVIRNSNSI